MQQTEIESHTKWPEDQQQELGHHKKKWVQTDHFFINWVCFEDKLTEKE